MSLENYTIFFLGIIIGAILGALIQEWIVHSPQEPVLVSINYNTETKLFECLLKKRKGLEHTEYVYTSGYYNNAYNEKGDRVFYEGLIQDMQKNETLDWSA